MAPAEHTATEPKPVRVALAGFGYWGANIARNLDDIPGCELRWCCELDPLLCEQGRAAFPATRFVERIEEALEDPLLDAVAVATPVATHASIALKALEAGRHCFVEKPIAQTVVDATDVARLAEERNRVLMVGHLLAYHPAVEALRQLVHGGELGNLHYIHSQRLNLGKLRADENALWSLGAHDVSMVVELLGELPAEASARGHSYVRDGIEDVVFGFLRFPSGVSARLHLSWLDPHKERRLTIVGSRRMATFDDMKPDAKLIVYDKGFVPDAGDGDYVPRSGESHAPSIPDREPLRMELIHFLECVREGREPRTGGAAGVRVVRVLEALQASLEMDGAPVELIPTAL